MNYIIAKHTHPSVWPLYWDSNPQEGLDDNANLAVSLDKSYSAADTYTGQQLNIKSSYETREEAERDCERMLAENPSGNYAVCPVAY